MHRVRILILDRHADHAATLAMLFEANDCVVLTTDDPGKAMALIEDHRPDVLVIDLDIDGAHGVISAAREANPRGALIACLSGRRVKHQDECAVHLTKPYAVPELFQKVEDFIARRGIEKRSANGR